MIDDRMYVGKDGEPLFLDEPDDLPRSSKTESEGFDGLFEDEHAPRISPESTPVLPPESKPAAARLIAVILTGALLGFAVAHALLN